MPGQDEHGAVIRVDLRGLEATWDLDAITACEAGDASIVTSFGRLDSQLLVGSGYRRLLISESENAVSCGVDEGRWDVLPSGVGDGLASGEDRGRHALEEVVVLVAFGLGEVVWNLRLVNVSIFGGLNCGSAACHPALEEPWVEGRWRMKT